MPSKTRKTSSAKPKTWGNKKLGTTTKKNSTASAKSSAAKKSTSHKNTSPRPSNNSNHKKRKTQSKHRVLKFFLIFFGSLFALGVAAFIYLYATTSVPKAEDMALAQKTTVYYSDGKTQIGSFAQQNREIIECGTLPDYVGNAVVSSENRTFWTDSGIDLRGIGRALINNVTKGTRQGGSTITQQYAERYYLGQTESYLGKLREAFLALKITQSQDKSTVLCNYMNTIYFGRDAYGIEAAAKNYFGKSAKDLTLSESVLLAGIIPAPNTWDPANNKTQAESRFKRTLNIMVEDGYVTEAQAKKATFPDTIDYKQTNVYSGYKGYLLQMVKQELTSSKTFSEDELNTGGYKIISTLDATKQAAMQKVGETRLSGVPSGVEQGGISVDPRDGSIYALYAGNDYIKHPLNNATQAQFQPGSTMKPFALLATVQKGVSLNTRFNGNSPRTFSGISKSVSNSGGRSYGYINLYQATANSVNTVFMDLNEHLTPKVTAETAHKAGIKGDIDETSPYNVLGINSLTALDLARGHSAIANGGSTVTIHVVKSVQNTAGKELYKASTKTTQVFDKDDTSLVIKAMEGVVTSGTAKEASSLGRTIAGKTGTANDGKSVSFVGYIPQMVTVFGVWYPDSDGNPQELPDSFGAYYGSAYPVHLFTEYSKTAFKGLKVESFPTATDDGKVGGSDGTWGLGATSSSSSGSTSNNQSRNESGSDSDSSESKNSTGTGGSTDSGADSGSGSGTDSDSGSSTGNSGSSNGNGQTETTPGTSGESSSGNGSSTNNGGSTSNGTGTGTGNNGSTNSGSGNGSNNGTGNSGSTSNGNNGNSTGTGSGKKNAN